MSRTRCERNEGDPGLSELSLLWGPCPKHLQGSIRFANKLLITGHDNSEEDRATRRRGGDDEVLSAAGQMKVRGRNVELTSSPVALPHDNLPPRSCPELF